MSSQHENRVFAIRLRQIWNTLKGMEGKPIGLIMDELFLEMERQGLLDKHTQERSTNPLEYWGRGHIPNNLAIVDLLAEIGVKRARLPREWLNDFLRAAGYSETLRKQRIHGLFGQDKQALVGQLNVNLNDMKGPFRPLRIFLCHCSEDKPAVRKLYEQLKSSGTNPWLDEENLLPGQQWKQEIPKAVRKSDIVLVCLSPKAITKSGYVQKEIRFALDIAEEKPEDTIFLIPVKLEECEVPQRLADLQWVNLFEPQGFQRLLRALKKGAESLNIKI